MKEVLVMFDYAAKPPLWGINGGALWSRAPLEHGLRHALDAWVDEGERLYRLSWGDDDDVPPSKEFVAWNEGGRLLAAWVGRELGDDFEVWYRDEVTRHRVRVDWD